ncbi:Propeptide PepSY amd peptidase M4 [Methanolacinia petrolearia DSM 11571]|uniref:Propeptide PepSY amd peptidase M4 n=1 Tax=Methanolacinia petrolearia (strain DSM 11571 / OCM 486 / SEBR 4847) TaxID=679926 RepID=E1RFK1_METP4|nr:hypothetical protein [Methanolacinia petrolearia]ADN36231.1 Propeptide PepSY amd peptidase M4 [Methanolacinia petrolearia DSM 11571]
MKKQQKVISTLLVSLCTILIILTAGCTYNSPNQQENTQVTQTESVTAETTQSVQSGSTQPTVSWKDFYPEYSEYNDQTREELIEEAKDEIMRLFPNVDRSTLNGQWQEHVYTYTSIAYGYPVIVFENADFTSDNFMALQEEMSNGDSSRIQRNLVRIVYDPKSKKVLDFGSYGYSTPPASAERRVTSEEAKEKCLNLIKKVKGEDFVNNEMNDYSIIFTDLEAEDNQGEVIIELEGYPYENVPYLNGGIFVDYNLVLDEVLGYSDYTYDPELLAALTTLSPNPEIKTLEEAKGIFEAKVAERYPGEVDIDYRTDEGFTTNALVWDNIPKNIFSDNPEPFKLVWYLVFNSGNARREAVIDAHTGEITYLRYKDIDIDTYD